MKAHFLLLSLAFGVSSAYAQAPASVSHAVPPQLMAACEQVINKGTASQTWHTAPIQYSTEGAGGWHAKGKTFQAPESDMTASNVSAVDGPFAMWSRKDAIYVYAAYETSTLNDFVYFICRADPASGAVISAAERGVSRTSPKE
jgi:hypothetical protein